MEQSPVILAMLLVTSSLCCALHGYAKQQCASGPISSAAAALLC